jgi:hypothetical protein
MPFGRAAMRQSDVNPQRNLHSTFRNTALTVTAPAAIASQGVTGWETDWRSRLSKEERPMRDLPDLKPFSADLIGDMHKAFEAVCAKLRLAPQSDKATAWWSRRSSIWRRPAGEATILRPRPCGFSAHHHRRIAER